MPAFLQAWFDRVISESGILQRAPSAAAVLVCLSLLAGVVAGWTFHAIVYTAVIAAKDERLAGLKDENERLAKSLGQALTSTNPESDLDTIIQYGARVGRIVGAREALSEGKIYFSELAVTSKFNGKEKFTYRKYILKIDNYKDDYNIVIGDGDNNFVYSSLKCSIIEKK